MAQVPQRLFARAAEAGLCEVRLRFAEHDFHGLGTPGGGGTI